MRTNLQNEYMQACVKSKDISKFLYILPFNIAIYFWKNFIENMFKKNYTSRRLRISAI